MTPPAPTVVGLVAELRAEIRRMEDDLTAALNIARRSADDCEILRNHRGRLENALADIMEHPDASRGIQNIARAALAPEGEEQ